MSTAALIRGSSGEPSTKADKKEAEVLMNTLKNAGQIHTPTTPTPTKRGRPAGSKNATSKSPSRKPSAQDVPADEVLQRMKKRKLINQLRAMKEYFPEIAEDLADINPHKYTAEQLKEIIEECKDSIQVKTEILSYPNMFLTAVQTAEDAAFSAGTANPTDPFLSHGAYLKGLSQALSQDANVMKDIKLISLDMMGVMPSNPWLRLFYNGCNLLYRVHSTNKAAMTGNGVYADLQ